ncbi:MAG: HAMP domain-containing histidine kinase [Lachnospiraceae bacterium]|nr:HAMP domain-containing histidine kinase [Lachnospiraceae bacterium]
MNAKEIHRLKWKFIVTAMLSFFLVMVFIGVVINVSSHAVTVNSIKTTLANITRNQGVRDEYDGIFDRSDNRPFTPSIGDIFSPSYRHNHFFFMEFEDDDVCVFVSNSDNSSELDLVYEYSTEILKSDKTFGHYGVYYYLKEYLEDGSVTLAILDCTSEEEATLRILTATIVTMLIALLITYILVRVLSNKLIQPEIENSRRQRQFITNASHELKTPLAVIQANTELLEATGGENEWTRSTINQVEHLNGLIQNLVMIAKAEEKEDTSNMVSINASDIVEQTVSPYEALAIQSGKELVKAIDKDVMVVADESKLRQLTTILIDNAIKYCDENGKVTVALDQTRKGKIRLAVSNSYAEGRDVDYNRFFDRFYREDKSHNIDKGGYGIGLSIADSICRQYGGDIRANWKDGVISFVCQL